MFYDGSVHKLQINMINELGDTALHMASKWGYGECVQQREVEGGGGGARKTTTDTLSLIALIRHAQNV